MARERRDEDPPPRVLDDVAQVAPHGGLRRREPGPRGVGGVGEQQVDALGAELVDRMEVGTAAVDRRLVELEVAGVHNRARRRGDEHAKGGGDRVCHREERDGEGAERDRGAVVDLARLRVLDVVLLELALDDAQGELARVDGDLAREVLQQIRQGASVVLVAVRDDDAAELVLVLQDVGVVGQDEVDAGLALVGKHQAGVDQDHVVAVLEGGHVLADAVEAAERDDPERDVFLGHS